VSTVRRLVKRNVNSRKESPGKRKVTSQTESYQTNGKLAIKRKAGSEMENYQKKGSLQVKLKVSSQTDSY